MGKKKRSSSTGSLKGFILLLLILGGGAYFYQNQQNLPEAKELTKEFSHTLEKAQKEVAQRLPEKSQDETEAQPSGNSCHADQTGRNQIAADGIYRFIQ